MIKYDQFYTDYRNDPALGSTDVVQLCKSLKHFYDYRNEQKSDDNLTLGTLIHTLILQPDLFSDNYAVYDGNKTKASKEYKTYCAENAGKIIIKKAMLSTAMKAVNSLKRHKVYQYFEKGFPEVSIYEKLYEVDCKGRLDYLTFDKKTIFDIKTINEIDKWNSHVKEYGYHIQSFLYMSLLSKVLEVDFSKINMFFILIEKKNDRMYIALRKMDEKSIIVAENQVIGALEKYQKAVDEGLNLADQNAFDINPIEGGLPNYILHEYFSNMENLHE